MRRFLFALLLLVAGCEPAGQSPPSTFASSEAEYKIAIVVDVTSSFDDMADKAYQFTLAVIERYMRDRLGSNDKIIIARISANERPLLWEGTSRALQEQFTPENFRSLLLNGRDPNGSPVHLATCNTVEYLMDDPQIASGTARSALFILSDMEDNFPKTDEMKERILTDLRDYGKLGGRVGIYYCAQEKQRQWKTALSQAGIPDFRVECGIVSKPDLPNFWQ